MKFAFDLISDLHVETWRQFDWQGQATSPFCVVAGDVAQDPTTVGKTLEHLSESYQAVFYIDGNDEHKSNWADIGGNYQDLTDAIEQIEDVVYLQDNVVIINGVAIVGTNGWWTWDFDPGADVAQTQQWFQQHYHCTAGTTEAITQLALSDAVYLAASIKKLQTHVDARQIVVVSHTVPLPELVQHDIPLNQSYRINIMGNSLMQDILSADTEHKIKTWCFGHYHGSVDQTIRGIRYVNNCRGRGDTNWNQSVYYPRRIEIEI
jgi:UDP-2,3-diacylglucosamine pyrophosphatase LpxH